MITDTYRHKGMRKALVNLLHEKGIRDERVLQAIAEVPRHYFFEKAFLEHAYQDKAFPIGEGQTISQPYTVAYQTELLDLKPTDKVLEIGTGSGYQCSILLKITPQVYTIEYNQVLYQKARKAFHDLKLYVNLTEELNITGLDKAKFRMLWQVNAASNPQDYFAIDNIRLIHF